ncbi:MAG: D-lysine 5,6-aminomutase subunit alpha, partial [Bacteroidales bacterium]|nr:D-lysine 5,6-aminomutase subunit alpha [Bacteroidales bacterium]
IFNNMYDIGEEMEFREGGIVRTRAAFVLEKAIALLEKISEEGLFSALEKGMFADVKRPKNGGKGLSGVSEKGSHYVNPFIDMMKNRLYL